MCFPVCSYVVAKVINIFLALCRHKRKRRETVFLIVFMGPVLLLRVHFPEAFSYTHLKKKKKTTLSKACFKKKKKKKKDLIVMVQNWGSQ